MNWTAMVLAAGRIVKWRVSRVRQEILADAISSWLWDLEFGFVKKS